MLRRRTDFCLMLVIPKQLNLKSLAMQTRQKAAFVRRKQKPILQVVLVYQRFRSIIQHSRSLERVDILQRMARIIKNIFNIARGCVEKLYREGLRKTP